MSQFIIWDSRRMLGVNKIDEGHKHIAMSMNDIYDYICQGEKIDKSYLELMLHKFFRSYSQHFECEEKIMAEHCYPDLKNHKQEHFLLIVELKNYLSNIKVQQLNVNHRTLESLKIWFLCHIRSSDKKFANYYHCSLRQKMGNETSEYLNRPDSFPVRD